MQLYVCVLTFPCLSTCSLLLQPEGKPPLPWPSVHAPWYGYLFWTAVTAGGFGRDADSTFVAANVDRWENCTANIKVRVVTAVS